MGAGSHDGQQTGVILRLGNTRRTAIALLLDFSYATCLRTSEFVGARLGDIRTGENDAHWLNLVGKGGKAQGSVTATRPHRT